MNESHRFPLPVFLGGVEALAFFCLFLSPIVGPEIWVAIGMLRALVFGVVVLPGRACAEAPEGASTFLGQSLLYQLPFWVAALFFPLQPGQAWGASQALLGHFVLLGLLTLLVRATRGRISLAAEGWVGALTLIWLALCPGHGVPWLAATVLLLAGVRGPAARRRVGWSLSFGQALAVGVGWLAAYVMPPLLGQPAGTELIAVWLFQIYLAAVIRCLQDEAQACSEDELSLPAAVSARHWLLGRRSVLVALGWAVLPLLLLSSPQGALGAVVLYTGWWRGVALAARGRLTSTLTVWWLGSEMSLVWGALLPYPAFAGEVVLVSFVWAGAVRLLSTREKSGERKMALPGLGLLERRLREELRVAAPGDFASRVRQVSDSVELDADLSAAAPAGFRARLLQRLRQGEETEES